MCVAVPLRIREIRGSEALAEAFGVTRRIRVDLVPEISAGDYVIVHAGIALAKIRESEAEENLEMIRDVIDAEKSVGAPVLSAVMDGFEEDKHASEL